MKWWLVYCLLVGVAFGIVIDDANTRVVITSLWIAVSWLFLAKWREAR